MLAKERRSLSLSKRPPVANSGTFDWFDRLTNRLRHRSNASAYFVDHHQLLITWTARKAGQRHLLINHYGTITVPEPVAELVEAVEGTYHKAGRFDKLSDRVSKRGC